MYTKTQVYMYVYVSYYVYTYDIYHSLLSTFLCISVGLHAVSHICAQYHHRPSDQIPLFVPICTNKEYIHIHLQSLSIQRTI